MSSVTYGKCYLWQVLLLEKLFKASEFIASVIMAIVIMASFVMVILANAFMAKVLWQIQKRSKVL